MFFLFLIVYLAPYTELACSWHTINSIYLFEFKATQILAAWT